MKFFKNLGLKKFDSGFLGSWICDAPKNEFPQACGNLTKTSSDLDTKGQKAY